jgi:hypothetical protein
MNQMYEITTTQQWEGAEIRRIGQHIIDTNAGK